MLASQATVAAVQGVGIVAVELSNHTSFLWPVFEGTIHAEVRRLHRGRYLSIPRLTDRSVDSFLPARLDCRRVIGVTVFRATR